jgi:hypothetical protein
MVVQRLGYLAFELNLQILYRDGCSFAIFVSFFSLWAEYRAPPRNKYMIFTEMDVLSPSL